jgi:LPXTG-motif cell wall-anchored protein
LALVANPDNNVARQALGRIQSSKILPILDVACIVCGGALFLGLLGALVLPQTGNFDIAFIAAVVALLGGFGLLLLLPIRKRYTSSVDVEHEAQRVRDSLSRKAAVFSHLDEWGEATCRLIYDGSIRPEMTSEMVRLAWGVPPMIDQVEVTIQYTKERWVYDDSPDRDANYVYFRDGAVTKIIWN